MQKKTISCSNEANELINLSLDFTKEELQKLEKFSSNKETINEIDQNDPKEPLESKGKL